MRITIFIAGVALSGCTLAAEFDHPWKNPNNAILIDPYYANSINWEKLATELRVVAIIHKSTNGTSKIDPQYWVRKTEAKKSGDISGVHITGACQEILKNRLTTTLTPSNPQKTS